DRRIEVTLQRIRNEPAKSWSATDLASGVNLSRSRFRHLFKQETGVTSTQFLKELRVRNGEVLLRTSFLTVKEIANRVGLASSSYFVREFRRVFGMSPTVYRSTFGPKK